MEGAFLAEEMARIKTLSTRASGMCGWSQENPAVSGEQSMRVGSGQGRGVRALGSLCAMGARSWTWGDRFSTSSLTGTGKAKRGGQH